MIQVKSINFHNVLFVKKLLLASQWKEAAVALRKFAFDNGLYQTGPIFYENGSITEIDFPDEMPREYTIYLPVNAPLQVKTGEGLGFLDKFCIHSGLTYRQPDSDRPEKSTYALLMVAAEQNNYVLESSFYHLFLDVYGEGLLEVYAPIKGGA